MSVPKRILRILLTAVLIFGLAGGAWHVLRSSESGPDWTVVGRVVDEARNPVENARVKAVICLDVEGEALTDSRGKFLVAVMHSAGCQWIDPGVIVKKDGYRENLIYYERLPQDSKITRVTVMLRKSDPNIPEDYDISFREFKNANFLLWVVANGCKRTDIMEMALKRGADVNCRDEGGQTPLIVACRGVGPGQLHAVKLLLDKGADVNAKDRNGMTALMQACAGGGMGQSEVVRLLLEKGAEVNARDCEGSTALIYVCSGGEPPRDLAVVKLLLEKGADVNARDHDGKTALDWAARDREVALERLLKAHGAKER